jgi:hypothetical protein
MNETETQPLTQPPAEDVQPHGWKTYLAAGAAVITGVSMVVNGQVGEGITITIGGLALIGLRGAAAKIIQVVQSLTSTLNKK